MTRWYLRSLIREHGQLVHLDEGPLDHFLATLLLEAIGMPGEDQGTIPRGLGTVPVERARLISEEEADD